MPSKTKKKKANVTIQKIVVQDPDKFLDELKFKGELIDWKLNQEEYSSYAKIYGLGLFLGLIWLELAFLYFISQA